MTVEREYKITNTETGEVFCGNSNQCAEKIGVMRQSLWAKASKQRQGLQRGSLWAIEIVKEDNRPGADVNQHTLCWSCRRSLLIAGVACSWAARFEPVDGWDAVETSLSSNGNRIKSYCVISCPQFLEG